ncbi:MAG TPA: hypothetical protein VGN16_01200 [Acidobacteriaceae bacterium]
MAEEFEGLKARYMLSPISPKMYDSSRLEIAAIAQAFVAAYMSGLQPFASVTTSFMGFHPMLVYTAPLALGGLLVCASVTSPMTNETVAAVSSIKVGSDGGRLERKLA